MTSPQATILVIEDELPIRRFLRTSLTGNGYRLIEAASGREGLQLAAAARPDCIILDLGLPDMDGLAVAGELRGWTQTPIIVLTARGQEQDKIALLDAGADDYLTKPFGAGELLARIRAAIRRGALAQPGQGEPVFQVGALRVDLAMRQVFLGAEEVRLTPIEYKLLATLVRHAGKVLTQRQLLIEVWGPEYVDAGHYVRVYMQHLRHKLEADPARPVYFVTEPGVGYRLRLDL
ncbi:response regulator [Oscillochloris sp. ZM17-4]|uniref:response regulator n=1 Tax=Oscillochloris sp. ZM17-4 TaxID=2866714 RepID=UPI001C736878|nr:response regulator [Oscillochloris sp. ZM17-4]MBX0328876.1 response regulator [Oscillochloris sp. ZM17-4]